MLKNNVNASHWNRTGVVKDEGHRLQMVTRQTNLQIFPYQSPSHIEVIHI